jgi:hypothetical protein
VTHVLSAKCSGGVVTIGAITVKGATILGAGVKSSNGLLILQDDAAPVYIASNSTDLSQTIDDLISVVTSVSAALTTVSTTLTAIGAGMTGPSTAPPPTLPAAVLDLTSKVSALSLVKTDLQTLKGALT